MCRLRTTTRTRTDRLLAAARSHASRPGAGQIRFHRDRTTKPGTSLAGIPGPVCDVAQARIHISRQRLKCLVPRIPRDHFVADRGGRAKVLPSLLYTAGLEE